MYISQPQRAKTKPIGIIVKVVISKFFSKNSIPNGITDPAIIRSVPLKVKTKPQNFVKVSNCLVGREYLIKDLLSFVVKRYIKAKNEPKLIDRLLL
jgi:hypothetical protein